MTHLLVARLSAARILPIAGLVLLGALAVWLPFRVESFRLLQLSFVIAFAITTLGLNLVTGYTGQISLAQGAFFGIGAYTVAVLVASHGWPYLAALPAAGALACVVGLLFGLPALRIRGMSLALVTVALSVNLRPLLEKFASLTGGKNGVIVPKPTAPAWTHLDNRKYIYFLALAIAVLMFAAAKGIVRGRTGRAMLTIRDNELVAETMGIRSSLIKMASFGVAALYAGIGGGLYALMVGVVTSDSFPLLLSVGFLAAVVVGGEATVMGAVFGALFVQFVPYYASDINPGLAPVIYGVSIITFMLLMRGGVMGAGRRVMSVLRAREREREQRPAPSHEPLVRSPSHEAAGSQRAIPAFLGPPTGPSGEIIEHLSTQRGITP